MGRAQCVEFAAWRCRCSALQCPQLVARLAELGCNNALISKMRPHASGETTYHVHAPIDIGDVRYKLTTLDAWHASLKCRAPENGKWYLISDPSDTVTIPSLVVSHDLVQLFTTIGRGMYDDTHTPPHTAIRDVMESAEAYGIDPSVVLRYPRYNILHSLATVSRPAKMYEMTAALIRQVQDVVSPSDFRQMLVSRDAKGRTPHDIAAGYDRTSDTARLFQPIGPKSAAGAE